MLLRGQRYFEFGLHLIRLNIPSYFQLFVLLPQSLQHIIELGIMELNLIIDWDLGNV